MKINELRLDEFVELPAMISPKREREGQRDEENCVLVPCNLQLGRTALQSGQPGSYTDCCQ